MWYKICQQIFDPEQSFKIDNFSDRNLINARIKDLSDLADMLDYCARLVYQTQRGARNVASQIRNNKKVSSFPNVVDILDKADQLAMDSPSKFAELCKDAAFELDQRINKLKAMRKEFAAKPVNYLKPKKGIF